MTAYQRLFGAGPRLLLLAVALSVGAVELQKVTRLPRPELSLPARLSLTGAVLALGGSLVIWSLRTLPFHQRGQTLVTRGPFRYVRHPLYTATFLSLGLAVFFVTQTVLALAALALMFLLGRVLVRGEEAYLEKRFGQQWLNYAQRTPRFFPRLRGRRQR